MVARLKRYDKYLQMKNKQRKKQLKRTNKLLLEMRASQLHQIVALRGENLRLRKQRLALLEVCQLATRLKQGSFEGGWRMDVTGHQMNAIQEAMKAANED